MRAENIARSDLIRRGRRLEYFAIGYNCIEGLVAIIGGILAGSIALIGFGFDSVIEVVSASILVWRLHADQDEERRERIESMALKAVGICFLVLALYVAYDSITSLVRHQAPDESILGIGLAITSLIIMPLLWRAKRKVARQIQSKALAADSKQTELCTYLSAILLGGLLLNVFWGWWWADPIAALAMTPIIVKEGMEALRGETCCE